MDAQRVITFQLGSQNRQTVVSAPGGRFPDAQSFGDYLRNLREREGIPLTRIAQQTRIAVTKFDALERGDLGRLPAGFYGRAVVRAYATGVGLDPVEIVREFEHLVPRQELPLPSADQVKPPAAEDALPRWAGSAVAALILGVSYSALGYWTAPDSAPQPTARRADALASASTPAPAELQAAATTGDSVLESGIELVSTDVTPPEPPQPIESTLRVTSNPSGARVTVNGIGWGNTPLVIRYLPPGAKTVRVTKDGFEGAEATVMLGEDGPASVRLVLQPLTIR